MNKYEQAERELNKYPAPSCFHDMSVVNFRIKDGKIKIRYAFVEYMDDWNILDNETDYAIVDVVYDGVEVKNIYLEDSIDFVDATALDLSNDKNNVMTFGMHFRFADFYLEFTYKSYKWSVFGVVTEDEYYKNISIYSNLDNNKM